MANNKTTHQSYAEEFTQDCLSYCDEHHIGIISEDVIQNCFEMPKEGVRVRYFGYKNIYYPAINSTCFDCSAAQCIGHFCTNNGKVVFVYRNGKTYVAKGYKILDELRAAGYTESSMLVPFSKREQIQDPILRARWESIKYS